MAVRRTSPHRVDAHELRALEVGADGSISTDARCVSCAYDLTGIAIDGACPECGLAVQRSSGVFIAAREGLITAEVPCGSCGYSLRGLQIDGVCPECATPARPSALGGRLEAAAPSYVTMLSRGATLVSIASVLLFVMLGVQVVSAVLDLTGVMNFGLGGQVVQSIIFGGWSIVSLLLYAVGWWMLTAKDPVRGKAMVADQARRSTRLGLILMTCTLPFLIVLSGGIGGTGFAAGAAIAGVGIFFASVLTLIGVILQYVRSMTYLGKMSSRMALPKVRGRADALAWAGPLVVIAGSIVAAVVANTVSFGGGGAPTASMAQFIANIGPAVILVMYWRLIEMVRGGLKEVRQVQASWVPEVVADNGESPLP